MMTSSLFAYGTLEFTEIMAALTGRIHRGVPATLDDHAAYRLRNRVYPGLRHEPGETTPGTLYLKIDARTMKILDWFEDDCYQRRRISVATETGERVKAEVYLLSPGSTPLLTDARWERERFPRQFLADYVVRCHEYHRQACRELGLAPSVPTGPLGTAEFR